MLHLSCCSLIIDINMSCQLKIDNGDRLDIEYMGLLRRDDIKEMGSKASKNQLSSNNVVCDINPITTSFNVDSIQHNDIKIQKASLHSKIINLTSFNEELSSVDVVLLSILMNNVITYTYHNLILYEVIVTEWKSKKMIYVWRCRMSLHDSIITSINEKLRVLIDDRTSHDNIILYCHLLEKSCAEGRTMSSIRVNGDQIIAHRGGFFSHRLSTIKRLDKQDVTWYSGITSVYSYSLKIKIDCIVVNNDVVEFSYCDNEHKLLIYNGGKQRNEYYIDTGDIEDDNITNNVRIALNHMINEYYS